LKPWIAKAVARPCVLDPGNPCQDDASANRSTSNVNIAFEKSICWVKAIAYPTYINNYKNSLLLAFIRVKV